MDLKFRNIPSHNYLQLFSIVFLLISFPVLSQEVTVTGKVTSANDDFPLPGVSVLVLNSNRGTATDLDGNYSIRTGANDILLFSYVGFVEKTISIEKRETINVALVTSTSELDEVVVVGYGTVKKSDLTGAVSQFKPEDMEELPISSVDQMLQGRVSGVQITQSSGAPGAGLSFNIRGGNSLGSNQPLIVIDGYPIDSNAGNNSLGGDRSISDQPANNALTNVDPNDIESIEILKDASSTAIYGSRGANGVVLITTKSGKQGKDVISVNYRSDISSVRNKIDVLNSKDYINYRNEGATNDGLEPVFDADEIEALSGVNNNWQDEIFQTAVSQDVQVSLTGGSSNSRYAAIANYYDNQGIVRNSNFKRGSIRLNYQRDISDNFNFRLNMAATKTGSDFQINSGREGLVSSNVITSALFFRPFDQGFDEFGDIEQEVANNPLTILNLVRDERENTFVLSNFQSELKFTDSFSLKTNLGLNNNNGSRRAYFPRGTFLGDQREGYAFQANNSLFNYLIENTLNYVKDFGTSRINAVGGYSWQAWQSRGIGTPASGFVNDNLTFENFESATSPGISNTRHQEWALSSFLGRINYSLLDRYLFTVTGRADGSTRLAAGNKWAFFPSAAIGWRIDKEPFMKNVKSINNLKLRASYGVSGNQNINIGATQNNLNTDRYPIGGTIINGYVLQNIANPNLGWETTSQYNVGMDLGLWKNRVKLEANYYHKTTTDLLISLPIPSTTGFGSYIANSGEVQNNGLEIDLTARILTKKFKWSLLGNISFNRNEMKSLGLLGDDALIFGPSYLGAGNALNQPIHVAAVGNPIGSFYGYQVDGVYQNQQEVDQGAESNAKPGDIRFVDINDDGQITADDRSIIGNPNPDYIFGLTSEFKWNNLSLSIFIQGVIGNEIANLNNFRLDALSGTFNNVRQVAYDNRWTGEGTSNLFPRASASGTFYGARFSNFVLEDGSFIRLKNVNLAYNLSNLDLDFLDSASIFLTGTNLITWTDYSGYDPEVNADFNSGLTPGVDNGTYPQTITVSLGLNLKF